MRISKPLPIIAALAALLAAALLLSGCGASVPNVVGMMPADAVRALEQAGYKLGTNSACSTTTVPLGAVAAQSPAALERAKQGTAVDLTICYSNGTRVQVPNVKGLAPAAAESFARGVNLVPMVVEQYSSEKAGLVYAQVPDVGANVDASSTLLIVVSKGPAPEKAKVPDVKGTSQSDAESAIKSAGFTAVAYSVYDSTVAKGKVIGQVPDAGTSLKVGSEVQIVVSLGKGTGAVTVPNVKGKKESDAVTAIENAHLVADKIYKNDPTVPKGTVIDQFPTSGSTAAKGSGVLILISSGPTPSGTVTVPDVMGLSQADAKSKLSAEGFAVTVEQSGTAADTDVVIYQFPAAGEKAAAGADVLILVGASKQ